jgi:hypothetical protein
MKNYLHVPLLVTTLRVVLAFSGAPRPCVRRRASKMAFCRGDALSLSKRAAERAESKALTLRVLDNFIAPKHWTLSEIKFYPLPSQAILLT